MKCNEACEVLTSIASNELVSDIMSEVFFKIRDIVVCKDNSILDVIATDEQREKCIRDFEAHVKCIRYSLVFSDRIVNDLVRVQTALVDGFEEKCDGFLPTRCKSCPKYKGES